MGLKARKIKTMIETHADECMQKLNSSLGTHFELKANWNCLPENIDDWNWEDEALKTCFYNSYFYPMEMAFSEMFKDPMYKDAIQKQLDTIQIEGGESSPNCRIEGKSFIYNFTLSVNQKDIKYNEYFNRSASNAITKAIDHGLE